MPSSVMGNGSWKKALLPSLSNRRRDDKSSTRPPRLLASNTVSDIYTTSSVEHSDNGAAPPNTAENMDDRLVCDLLETTAETGVNSEVSMFGLPAQMRHFARSRTVGAVLSTDAVRLSSSPQKSQDTGGHIPHIPHKSSRRNLRSTARHFLGSSPGGNEDGLVRPMPTSQSVSSHFTSHESRRITQSSSMAGDRRSVRYQGDSPIRKGSSSPRKISHSVTSVLGNSQDFASNIADSANSGDLLKSSRSVTKNVFAKFAGVLTEHFTAKGSRKGVRSSESAQTASMSSEKTTQPLTRLSLNPLDLPIQDITNTRPSPRTDNDDRSMKPRNDKLTTGTSKSGFSPDERKRLTMVKEDDFQNGPLLEDPFSESSSGQHTTEFEARLKSAQGTRAGAITTDPFRAENILESSVDAMLTTPPVGCSTPQRRPLSLARCGTPTQESRETDHVANLIAFSPGVASAEPRQRNVSSLRGRPRKENQPLRGSRHRGFTGSKSTSRSEISTLSDSTRLSSFPPGSTIRHVPRSMARLTEVATLPLSTSDSAKALPLGRKKHPSPSKGQLEMFGKYMEKNLALGVFKDADELGLSFSSPQPGACALSPRDSNRLIRNTPTSNTDLRKDYVAHGNHTGLPKLRSRIPQPVKQLSRSRTDTAFARDFIPANKGDSTMGDELQWDSSAYKIGHRCNQCGSTNQIV